MVGSSLVIERVGESGSVELTREDKSVGISREPSFSGWFDEDGIPLPARLRNDEVNEEDFVFRLHLVQPQGSENGVLDREGCSGDCRQRMEHGGDIDGASPNDLRKQDESYVPLDIENGHDIDKTYTSSTSGYNRLDYNSPFSRNEEHPVSVSDVLKTLVLILVWYTFSTFLTLYNKTLLGDDMGKFPAPLLMNTIHFAMQAVLSTGITWFWSDRFHSSVMSWKDYFVRVVPTALSTALDVNLSNASLVFISVTFATMCKSAAPIFLLLFAFAFRLESPSVKLLGIILVISVGILLTVAKETEFEFWGFLFVMLAAVMSGFRWTMTQILLQV
ncbi:putative sugar phosphate/phosphate translocator [Sesamum alatum]|uniref:Sugar phosphate/phosphate translocator n=1 Tax=Sesamum alatum TaxID=300844 RepID=A0AAE1YYZ6_9LAMI|nr:putative sugar phosphate/phosphate translocator [Sesamum alatum]